MRIYIGGKAINLKTNDPLGFGGEAYVYKLKSDQAVKIFKDHKHPDYNNQPEEQLAAKHRLQEHQQKLKTYPSNLPSGVIKPQALVTNKSGKIIGYTMKFINDAEPLFSFGQKGWRLKSGINHNQVIKILLQLHHLIVGIHNAKVVIGDFNDLNVLIRQLSAYMIDSDSYQWGNFMTKAFTAKFTDPLLCELKDNVPYLRKPYVANSDWYAYAIMVMQTLLFVDPYGGVYKPKQKKKRIPQSARSMHRITVFNPQVKYPKPAIHFKNLDEQVLHYFYKVFEKDKRDEFPNRLLANMRWTTCTKCGNQHARHTCPECTSISQASVVTRLKVKGKVIANKIFDTSGVILHSCIQNNNPLWIYHEKGEFKRENKQTVISGQLDPKMRFRLLGNQTLIGRQDKLAVIKPGKENQMISIDTYQDYPVFDTNSQSYYWIQFGQLTKQGLFGPEILGKVLTSQTLFWTGEKFGFGFYRASQINIGFTFKADKSGINDTINIQPITGQLIDATCLFASDYCWFMTSSKAKHKITNRCSLIHRNGQVLAEAEADDGDGSWLGTIRGKSAAGKFLLCPTDEGIIKIVSDFSQLVVAEEFPDSEPFVDSDSQLLAASDRLFVVKRKEVLALTINK